MGDQSEIHTRLDYMEQRFDEKLGQMAESISRLADSTTKLTDRISDINLLTERSNQHAHQIDTLDKRVDKIESKLPIYDIVVNWGGKIAMLVSSLIILGIVGNFFMFE